MGARNRLRAKPVAALAAVGLAAGLLAACGSSDDSDGGGGTTSAASGAAHVGKKIAVVTSDPSGAYYQMGCGVRIEGQRLGLDVGETQAPSTPQDVAGQAKILQSVLATDPDGLVYTPADATAGAIGIKPAVTSGLPVVNVDAELRDPSLYISFIGSSNDAGGELGGRLLAEQIGESGEVAAIGILPDNPITIGRIGGFQRAMDQYPDIDVVAVEYPQIDVNKIAAAASALMAKHPDLRAIYTTNDLIATGVGTAIRTAGKSGEVKMITWDLQPAGVKLLKAGTATGSVVQKPREWGVAAAQQLAAKLDGKPVEKRIVVPNLTVTDENINDPDVRELYYSADC